MLIGIDANEANIKNRVGVNMYAFELLCSIYRLQDEWKKRLKFIIYLKDQPLDDLPRETSFWQYRVLPGKSFWIIRKLMLELFLTREKPDVFFSPSHYLPLLTPMPKVCSIMDLGYIEFSGQFKKRDYWQLKLWSAWSVFISKYIIAISKATQQDIVRHYPRSKGKVYVTPLAYNHQRFNPQAVTPDQVKQVKKKYYLQHYILFLSTLKPSKNVEGLVQAWEKICNEYPEYSLVIGGKKGWLYSSIYEQVKNLNLQGKVVFTDFVAENDKPMLLKGAKVFVSPSFWEGFGLHVLEAMAMGTPVIVSHRGSLPEVVGKAGVVVDPESSEEIAQGIRKVLGASKLEYNKLVRKSLAQAKKFSWEKTARKTLKILEKAKNV